MDKAHILLEIKRTALANGGIPLGFRRFESETGIRHSQWHGTHWARWNDAIREAGLAPNEMKPPTPVAALLEKYAQFAQELGRLPGYGDHRFKERRDPDFPDRSTFSNRIGSKAALVRQLLEYCRSRGEYQIVVALCEAFILSQQKKTDEEAPARVQTGFVYLLKHGSHRQYKIGRTNNRLRREGEIGIELPEQIQPIHVIETDDPAGVEAYWHRRFAEKRLRNEWFALTAEDVRAFKRWRRIY
jgi:Meiotically up-regulated gene 113